MRQAILALLTEGPMNGYQVMQTLDERTHGVWRPSPGAVYPALNQLTDEGLIAPVEKDGQKACALTDAGREAADKVTEKPWEAATRAAREAEPEGASGLWHEFGQVALAARAVLATGDAELIERASRLLNESRRKLYNLLAAEPDEQ